MRVKLDITTIPEDLYDKVLEEFRRVYGTGNTYDAWEISAEVEKDDSLTIRQVVANQGENK